MKNDFNNITNKFVIENEHIIYYALSKKYPWIASDDDLLQEARIWLLEAKNSYMHSKSSWKTYASKYINWKFKSLYLRNSRYKRNPKSFGYSVISLDSLPVDSDCLECSDSSYDKIENKYLIDSILQTIDDARRKDILKMVNNGILLHDIARKYFISPQRVSQIYLSELKRIRERMQSMVKYKVYISGPMKGKLDGNKLAFHNAELFLKAIGHTPINPHTLTENLVNPTYEQCMKIDIEYLLKCNAIHMLDGWKESKSATLEYNIAMALGFKVI